MNAIGKAISDAFGFVSTVGQECEALGRLLKQEISDMFRHSTLSEIYTAGDWSHSYQTDDSSWIFTGVAWSLPLTPKGKRKATGFLSFQIMLLCDNPESGMSPEPLLHINFWDEPVNFANNSYMGFEMHDLSPGSLVKFQKGKGRLFRWNNGGGTEQWTYTLNLADLNGLQDLRDLINRPVEQLLIETDAGEMALEQLAQVIQYTVVDDMPDYYRVVD